MGVHVEVFTCFFEIGVFLLTNVFELLDEVDTRKTVQNLKTVKHDIKRELGALIFDDGNQVFNCGSWDYAFEELVGTIRVAKGAVPQQCLESCEHELYHLRAHLRDVELLQKVLLEAPEAGSVLGPNQPTETFLEIAQNYGHKVCDRSTCVVRRHVKADLDVVNEFQLALLFNEVFLELIEHCEHFSQNTPIVGALFGPKFLS